MQILLWTSVTNEGTVEFKQGATAANNSDPLVLHHLFKGGAKGYLIKCLRRVDVPLRVCVCVAA